MRVTLLAVLIALDGAQSFVVSPTSGRPSISLKLGADGNGPSRSRLEGNQRDPTEDELAIMDEMIDKLSLAKPYELPNAVRRAFRVCSSPQFFMRIAERSDKASGEEQERLSALASNLVSTLEAVVETTEEQLDERAKEVERVVKAAAEPDSGEFLVPLIPERIDAMRSAIQKLDESSLDEGFLSTLDAWMNKSHQDGMDLMVQILQKVLQMYAGLQIKRSLDRQPETAALVSEPTKALFDKLLAADADAWNAIILEGTKSDVTIPELQKQVQRTMETIVLSLDAGSMAQRVQAEYLQEMSKRVESMEKA